jgi:hypothetical protein
MVCWTFLINFVFVNLLLFQYFFIIILTRRSGSFPLSQTVCFRIRNHSAPDETEILCRVVTNMDSLGCTFVNIFMDDKVDPFYKYGVSFGLFDFKLLIF